MRFHRVLIAGLACLALVGITYAQTDVGRSGAQFLKISPSARGVAMGGGYSAVAQDADAIYHNPAGLTGSTGASVQLSRVQYVADITFNYAAFSVPSLGGVVGVHFGSMGTDEMPVTTIQDPTNESGNTFDVSSWVAGVTYARPLTDRLSLGVTAKWVNEAIWDMNSGTMAFDVGTLYYTGFSNWRFAATLTNFGPQARFSGGHLVTQYNKYDDEQQAETVAEDRAAAYKLPMTFKIGTAYDFVITPGMMVTTSLEGAHPNDAMEYVAGGVEYSFTSSVVSLALRGGYRLAQTETMGAYKDLRTTSDGAILGVGVGVPFVAKKLMFDYTWQDFSELGTNHLFSFTLSL